METTNLEAYFEGAFRAAIASGFINGKISEQQIDIIKEAISKYREDEIEHVAIMPERRGELKRQWKQWIEATTQGIKDELRAKGKLG